MSCLFATGYFCQACTSEVIATLRQWLAEFATGYFCQACTNPEAHVASSAGSG
ncbi:MAG: hypothetical protein ACUVS4_03930 [Chloroflexaceae bacterium]